MSTDDRQNLYLELSSRRKCHDYCQWQSLWKVTRPAKLDQVLHSSDYVAGIQQLWKCVSRLCNCKRGSELATIYRTTTSAKSNTVIRANANRATMDPNAMSYRCLFLTDENTSPLLGEAMVGLDNFKLPIRRVYLSRLYWRT